jgi:hypothetical protein
MVEQMEIVADTMTGGAAAEAPKSTKSYKSVGIVGMFAKITQKGCNAAADAASEATPKATRGEVISEASAEKYPVGAAIVKAMMSFLAEASYFRGQMVDENRTISTSLARSALHKACRRKEGLLAVVMLHLKHGHFKSPMSYMLKDVFAEDIAMANPKLIVQLKSLYDKVNGIEMPLTAKRAKVVLRSVARAALLMNASGTSRAVASLATIAMDGAAKCSGSFDLDRELKLLRMAIDAVPSVMLIADENMRSLCVLLQRCLFCVPKPGETFTKKGLGRTKAMNRIWDVVADGFDDEDGVVRTLREVHRESSWVKRLNLFMALVYRCMPTRGGAAVAMPSKVEVHKAIEAVDLAGYEPPEYARDKHAGGAGGYKRFESEGSWSNPDIQWEPTMGAMLKKQAFDLRYARETIHGPNSSKTDSYRKSVLSSAGILVAKEEKRGKKRKASAIADVKFMAVKAENGDDNSASIIKQLGAKKVTFAESAKVKKEPKEPKESAKVKKEPKETAEPARKRFKFVPAFGGTMAQAICGRHKTPVEVTEDFVYKGPSANERCYNRSIEMANELTRVDEARGLKPSVDKPTPIEHNGDKYLRWANVGDFKKMTTSERVTKLQEPTAIADRGSYIKRLSDLARDAITPGIVTDAVNHFYARYVLGIGDTGPHNVLLATDGRVVGIDLEEARTFKVTPTTRMECLVARKFKHRDLYEAQVGNVVQLSEEYIAKMDEACQQRARAYAAMTA